MAEQQGERLQKVLANLGVASRRAAEEIISAGRVSVNGKVITELGSRVDPNKDEIMVDDRVLPKPNAVERVTYMLNKPFGVVSTASDPQGRPTVVGLLPKTHRLYPVGRLDYDSDGLILLTNDGDLAQRLMHPSHEVEREYEALVRGQPTVHHLRQLREGIMLEGEERVTARAQVKVLNSTGNETLLRFIIREGRNRQVRRMAEAVGLYVMRLKRTRIGPLLLGDLPVGKWRKLTADELKALEAALEGKAVSTTPGRGASPGAARPGTNPEQKQHGARPTDRPTHGPGRVRPERRPGSGQAPERIVRNPGPGQPERRNGPRPARPTKPRERP